MLINGGQAHLINRQHMPSQAPWTNGVNDGYDWQQQRWREGADDDGAAHAASTLDGARMVLASWCMTIEEIRDDPEQPVTGESAHLAHTIAIALGVPHLLRGTTYNSRNYDVRNCVASAALVQAMFDGDTWLDRELASVADVPDSGSVDQRALAARTADVSAGRIIAPSSCSDGEWWRRADAAERDASTRIFPQKNFERVFEPLLLEELTSTGVAAGPAELNEDEKKPREQLGRGGCKSDEPVHLRYVEPAWLAPAA